jgi:Mrp family chromosome partitioning ATPase
VRTAPPPVRSAAATGLARPDPAAAWARLRQVPLDAGHLTRHRLISAERADPAHVAFDVLRTKLLATLRKHGWGRVAITSATPDCGKSFVAANLAISLSRKPGLRAVLMDMDLRRPSLARVFGIRGPGALAPVLTGETAPEAHLLRPAPNDLHIGDTLALGLNDRAESYAAELLQSPATAEAMAGMQARLAPDVVLYDMPPALYHDDVLAFRPQFDGVLIVVAGGMSTAQEVRDLRDRLGTDTPLLGVVMNRAEGEDITRYEY